MDKEKKPFNMGWIIPLGVAMAIIGAIWIGCNNFFVAEEKQKSAQTAPAQTATKQCEGDTCVFGEGKHLFSLKKGEETKEYIALPDTPGTKVHYFINKVRGTENPIRIFKNSSFKENNGWVSEAGPFKLKAVEDGEYELVVKIEKI